MTISHKIIMKKIFYGIAIFLFSVAIGYYISSNLKTQKHSSLSQENLIQNTQNEFNITTVETVQADEKLEFDAEFAQKKYYDECGHFSFQYSELPKELVNLTRQEIEDLYDDWEVESFSPTSLTLSQEINSICDDHYIIKLGDNNIEVFNLKNDGELELYKETDISKNYLPPEDIETLTQGIAVYGKAKLNSTLEDFE